MTPPQKKLVTATQHVDVVRDPNTGLWTTAVEENSPKEETAAEQVLKQVTPQRQTIASAIAATSVRLARAGIDAPRQDAEILLAHAMNLTTPQLYQVWTEEIPSAAAQRYEDLILQRLQRIPVAYITGMAFFYGLPFVIDKRAMIPRPETEVMVERIIEHAKGWHEVTKYLVFADVGVGSGVITVSCAYHLNFLKLYAIDITENILELARINATKYHLEQNITFLQGNLLEPLPEPAHMIVANLPYISNAEFATLEPEVTQHEPKEALLAGDDGLWHIRELLKQAPERLLKGGKIFLEIGETQADAVVNMAKEHFRLASCEVVKDLAGKDRIVIIHTG